MRRVGMSEARRKLSELVDLAGAGERIEIMRRGKIVSVLGPPQPFRSVKEVFESIDRTRRRSRKLPGVTVKSLIEEGRI